MATFEKLLNIRKTKGAGYLVLIDPDKWDHKKIVELAVSANESGADGILMGGSLLLSYKFDDLVGLIKTQINIPLIISLAVLPKFPKMLMQFSFFR